MVLVGHRIVFRFLVFEGDHSLIVIEEYIKGKTVEERMKEGSTSMSGFLILHGWMKYEWNIILNR